MSQVVILHVADDTLPARALAEKLRLADLAIVLEKPLGAEARAAIEAAQVAIVLWSPRSVGEAALAADAEFARTHCKMIHAVMQNAQAPQQFLRERGVNLTGWRGEDDFPTWRQLAKFVTDAAGVTPPPPPPRPAASLFQPGAAANAQAAAPPQRPAPAATPGPAAKANTMVIAAIAVVVLGVGVGVALWMNRAQPLAAPSQSAWDDIDPTDAQDLRALLDNPELRAQAQRALEELEGPAFEAAMEDQDLNKLEQFLKDFPRSRYRDEIQRLIQELKQDIAPPPEAAAATTEAEPLPEPGEPGGPVDLTPPATEPPPAPPVEAPGN
jgi:hypothetical protein